MLMKVQRDLVAADVRTALDIMRTLLVLLLLSAVLDVLFSQRFIYVSSTMTWYEAQRYCTEVYTDLATITDMTDENKARSYTGGSGKVWIGLYRKNVISPWIWSDQSNFLFNRWAAGQPNNYGSFQFCVAATAGGWDDQSCTEQFSFVCYSEKKRQVLRVEVKSDENVNDPEVKKKVLEKIQHILNMKGLEGNVTLSWRNQSDGNVFQKKQKNKETQHTCH